MAEIQRIQMEVVMDETGALVGLKKTDKAVQNLEKTTKKTTGSMGKMSEFIKRNWLKATAGIAAGLLALKKAFDFTKEFAKYRQGMDALARNTGQNSDRIVAKLKAVSQGTVSNKDIMLAANRAVALNVTRDMDKVAKLLEIARVKGKAMGIDTTQAFNDMVTGIGRGCLSGETIINTNKGLKLLREIEEGMKVRSYDLERNEIEFQKVKKVFDNGIEVVFVLQLADYLTHLEATDIHSFYTDNGWKKMRELKVGDCLFTGFEFIKIISIEKKYAIKVYDLSVEKNENYFANGILCHNSPLILDNLGIITKGWAEEAKAAGKAMDTQFILNKILAQGAEELGRAGATAVTNAERYQKLGAAWENAKLRAGKFLTGAIMPLVDWVTRLLTPTEDLALQQVKLAEEQMKGAKATQKLIERYEVLANKSNRTRAENEEFRKVSVQLKETLPETVRGVDNLTNAYIINTKHARTATSANIKYARSLIMAEATEAEDAILDLGEEIDRLNKKIVFARSMQKSLQEEMDKTEKGTGKLKITTGTFIPVVSNSRKQSKMWGAQLTGNSEALGELDTKMAKYIKIVEKSIELGRKVPPAVLERIQAWKEEDKKMKAIAGSWEKIGEEGGKTGLKIKGTVETMKGAAADYYAFRDDQRKLDLLREKESYDAAVLGLAQMLLTQKQLKNLAAIEDEERRQKELEKALAGFQEFQVLTVQHQQNMIEIESAYRDQRREAERQLLQDLYQGWQSTVNTIAGQYSTGIADMIFEGQKFKKSFGDLVKDVLKGIARMIVEMLVFRTIMAIFGGGLFGLFFKRGGRVPEFAEGGKISGPSHAGGGVNINAEGGEFIVQKSKVTPDTLPILMAINKGINNIASLSVPANRPVRGYQEGGIINRDERRMVAIDRVEITSPEPRQLFEQLIEFGEDMGVDIARRG